MIATNIVDEVRVPEALEPGQYMLSWRWDSEQTNQVWQNWYLRVEGNRILITVIFLFQGE